MTKISYSLPFSLQTSRLWLRPVTLEDAPAMFSSFMQDADVAKYTTWTPSTELAQAEAFAQKCALKDAAGIETTYALCLKDEDDCIAGLLACRQQHGTRLDLGYLLAKKYWRQGLMAEAVTAMVEKTFQDGWCWRAQATCSVDNYGSQRTLEKSGFKREALLKQYLRHPNIDAEVPGDSWLYARIRKPI